MLLLEMQGKFAMATLQGWIFPTYLFRALVSRV